MPTKLTTLLPKYKNLIFFFVAFGITEMIGNRVENHFLIKQFPTVNLPIINSFASAFTFFTQWSLYPFIIFAILVFSIERAKQKAYSIPMAIVAVFAVNALLFHVGFSSPYFGFKNLSWLSYTIHLTTIVSVAYTLHKHKDNRWLGYIAYYLIGFVYSATMFNVMRIIHQYSGNFFNSQHIRALGYAIFFAMLYACLRMIDNRYSDKLITKHQYEIQDTK